MLWFLISIKPIDCHAVIIFSRYVNYRGYVEQAYVGIVIVLCIHTRSFVLKNTAKSYLPKYSYIYSPQFPVIKLALKLMSVEFEPLNNDKNR